MIKFLVYVAIILTIVAIGYLARVFELASKLKGSKPHEVTDKDNKFMSGMMLTWLVVFFAFVIWNLKKYVPLLLPESASEHGVAMDWLFNFNWAIIFFVFAVTQALLFFFAYKYYGRKNNTATYFPHNNKIEMIWTVIPAIVLSVIIILGLKQWNKITAPAPDDAIVIQIYGKQFDWTARYAGKDNELGTSNYRLITDNNALGMDSTDHKGFDDIVVRNEIHIPLNKEIAFKLNSRDVIHSAYFPHFRAQINCVPGMTTYIHFKPILTTAQMREKPEVKSQMAGINSRRVARGDKPVDFDYILLCNKICGNSHYNMQMTVVVDTEEDYKKWLSTKKPFFDKSVEVASK
jgi:cytochrome c oxidase subunit 2